MLRCNSVLNDKVDVTLVGFSKILNVSTFNEWPTTFEMSLYIISNTTKLVVALTICIAVNKLVSVNAQGKGDTVSQFISHLFIR